MPVLRQYHLRHFMVESADHLFVGPKLEMFNSRDQKIIHETTEKIVQIRQRLQAARDWQRMAYKLELPEELSNVYSTFQVSNLKKCLSDESLVIPMKELRLDDKLNFVEEPVEIMDREFKQLK
ncbi:hypothetical protein Tco_1203978 [Tanacetum coccineum]